MSKINAQAINKATRLLTISNNCLFRCKPLLVEKRFNESKILRERSKKFEICYKEQMNIVFGRVKE